MRFKDFTDRMIQLDLRQSRLITKFTIIIKVYPWKFFFVRRKFERILNKIAEQRLEALKQWQTFKQRGI